MGPRFWGGSERDGETPQRDQTINDAASGASDRRVIDLHSRRAVRVAVAEAPRARETGEREALGWREIAQTRQGGKQLNKHRGQSVRGQHGIPDAHRRDAGRHFLKFFLPIIPLTTFVFGFLYWYLALEVQSAAPSVSADATIPLMGACLLGLFSAMLCAITYLGYLKVRDHEMAAPVGPTQQGR
ncbi:MAG: hypothetical protein ABI068_02910 [Ktedonobacterales bacterium]